MPHADGASPESAKTNAFAAQAGPASEPLRATDSQWRIYGLINEWIRFADPKAGALLAANALMLVSAVGAFKDHKAFFNSHMLVSVLGVVGLVGLIASAYCCLVSIFPRTRAAGGKSLIFFDHIAGNASPGEYSRAADALGHEDRAFAEISEQVWQNARIAADKHEWIARAILAFIFGLSVSLVVGVFVAFS